MCQRKIITLVAIFAIFLSSPVFGKKSGKSVDKVSKEKIKISLELLYRDAQREFHRRNYVGALPLFEKYLKEGRSGLNQEERLFWVIDQIGYIHLRVKKDPEAATAFLKKYDGDSRLNDAQQDSISEWIAAAKDWQKEKLRPSKVKGADTLYRLGARYFKKGIGRKAFDMDNKGNADLSIAESYLRPFIINHDKDKRIGEALLMMGRIRLNLRTDSDYWAENYYLKEVIRRYPRSKIAQRAWRKLNEDTRIGYTGSSGDNTPPSILRMMERHRIAAFGKAKKGKKK